MNLTFFTNKCSHGAQILKEFKQHGIFFNAIFIEKPKSSSKIKKIRAFISNGKFIELILIIIKYIKSRLTLITDSDFDNLKQYDIDNYYLQYSKNLIFVDNFNGIECEKKLHNIKPDIIILGGSRIIKENIINIPKIGILNAHPGLLPKYRGVDIIPWAIHNGDDIGVTVHFIDKEVDTGDIIVQKIIEIEKYDTIKTLKSKAELLAAQLMVQVVLEIEKNGNVNRIPQLKSNGRQYYAMSTEILKNTEKILEGKKNELYNI